MSGSIENTYQKKTILEHILLRPDTYIGSIDFQSQLMWILKDSCDPPTVIQKQISYVPGLYKIFDEIIVNAADNIQRDKKMTMIKVTIDQAKGSIKVWNNGKGVPVVMHKTEKVYVPELIFGHVLTSSNYDDSMKKVTGGRNGYGAKLANIFSKKFEIECADTKNKKVYKQTFQKNMSIKGEPKISEFPADSSDYTSVYFEPDLKKFGMKEIDKDTLNLLKKRVYDLAGCSPNTVSVYLNGKKLTAIKGFQDYVNLYFPEKDTEMVKLYEKVNPRWEICVSLSDSGTFQQVSFVNNICTMRGGTHCNYISDQIVKKCAEILAKKNKKLNIKPAQIKNNLWIFINCLIENPAFDSQVKETLTLKKDDFGSTCDLSDTFLKKVTNCGIIQNIIDLAQAKESLDLKKKLGQQGKKKQRLLGIPKLEDANMAGTGHSSKCTLILTEGDSAKTLAMSGIQIVGRDYYGVFPLKGKLLNVREASNNILLNNQEIQNLMKIVGLTMGIDYQDPSNFTTLRYGCVMIMTDQDHDGSHIKGLLINFFEHFWPSLLKKNGFLKEFVTPIIKIVKKVGQNKQDKTFFTISEYKNWESDLVKSSNNGKAALDAFNIKYYKGLGTSTAKEAKEYFSDLTKHVIQFEKKNEECIEAIRLAFLKTLADKRKVWLSNYDINSFVDHNIKKLTYQDFIHKELIHFSIADNVRSIPNLMDGLKPGQRKILFACFKRKLKSEIKVAQLSGYIAEHSAYHHGEMSLCSTIVNMAQDFVGSNNLNFLMPQGQFGTRLMGGKEAASPRYIFTNLNPLTRVVFNEHDDALLNHLEDEGLKIEPLYYAPILPAILVNGCEGIGTGWSTNIPCYNPFDIISNIENRLKDSSYQFSRMVPWFKNFLGEIDPADGGNYLVKGVWKKLDKQSIEITELPIRKWTRDYKNFIEDLMMAGDLIEDLKEFHKDNTVHFVLKLKEDVDKLEKREGGILKHLKLTTNISCNNFVLFDKDHRIKKYDHEIQILEEFYNVRLDLYKQRKGHMMRLLEKEIAILENKARFISSINDGSLKIQGIPKASIIDLLISNSYLTQHQIDKILEPDCEDSGKSNFEYLLSMSIWSLTMERVDQINDQLKNKNKELEELRQSTAEKLWVRDLEEFKRMYDGGVNGKIKPQGEVNWKVSQAKPQAEVKTFVKPQATKKESPPKKLIESKKSVVKKPQDSDSLSSWSDEPQPPPSQPNKRETKSVAKKQAPSKKPSAKKKKIELISDEEMSDESVEYKPRGSSTRNNLVVLDSDSESDEPQPKKIAKKEEVKKSESPKKQETPKKDNPMTVDSPKKPLVSPTKNILVKKAEVETEGPPSKKGSLIDFFKKKKVEEPEPKKPETILQEKDSEEKSQDLTQRKQKSRAARTIDDDSD